MKNLRNITMLLTGYLLFQRMPMASLFGEIFFNMVNVEDGFSSNNIEFLKFTIKYSPFHLRAHFLLGGADISNAKYAKARDEFTIVTQLEPTNQNAHYWLGYSFQKLGNNSAAVEEYNKAVELAPEDVQLYKYLAEDYKKMGRKIESFAALHKAISLIKDTQAKLSLLTEASNLSIETADQIGIQPGPPLGFGRQTSLVIDKQGTYHLLARVNGTDLTVYAKSSDSGKTWESKRVVYIGSDFDGSLAIAPDGVVYAFFGEKGGMSVYTNSTLGFSKFILISDDADSKQIAVDQQGIVHLVWSDSKNDLWYCTVNKEQSSSNPTLVAKNGLFPALALNGSNIYVTYNLAVSYPDETGGVYFVEKTEAQWLPAIRLSESGKWAGASAITVDRQGNPYVIYYLADTQTPILQYATRKNINWKYLKLSDKYAPFIPVGAKLSFGGRTSPALAFIGDKLYFVWRSNADGSPIVLRILDLSKNQFSEESVIGELGEEPFGSAPSIIKSQLAINAPLILWSYNGMPVIYSAK